MLPHVLAASCHALGLQHFYTFQQAEVEDRIVFALTQDFLAYLNIITNFVTSDTPGLQNGEFHATTQYVKLLPLENFNWESSSNESQSGMVWRYLPSSPLPASRAKVCC